MWDSYHQLRDLLLPSERRKTLFVFGLILLVAVFEVLGIASVLPFMTIAASPERITTNVLLSRVYEFFGFASIAAFLSFAGMMVLAVLLVSLTLQMVSFRVRIRFVTDCSHSIGTRLVRGYLSQPYEWFLGQHGSEISRILISEINQVVYGALLTGLQAVAQIAVVVGISTLLIIINPLLALTVALVLGGAYLLIFQISKVISHRLGEERVEGSKHKFRVIHEAFGGIKDVKILGKERYFLNRYEKSSAQLARNQVSGKSIAEFPSYGMQGVVYGGIMLVLISLIDSEGSLARAVPVVSLYAFAAYRLMPALQSAFAQLSELRYSMPALKAVHADLKYLCPPGQGIDHQSSSAAANKTGKVSMNVALELRQIEFSYLSAKNRALDGVSLKIPSRTTAGIVGHSGSGKTTLVDIILGLLKPQNGQLVVDGVPLTDDDMATWRKSVGYVPQAIFLADETIAQNIAFGVDPQDIDQNAVIQAAKLANLHEFVVNELPEGYNTLTGERGVRLSGGQRQRIGIARALYNDPDVLVLDEATSALDNLTERAVMDAVKSLGSRKTIILIAHRLTTVQHCDRIFLLEGGHVVGEGSFQKLMDTNERFRAMAVAAEESADAGEKRE